MSATAEIINRERSIFESQAAKDFVERIFNLKIVLTRDLLACDAKWTLFVAAALSYRYDSQLKPFPPKYMTTQGVNIDALINTINEVPSLRIILNNIAEENYDELDTEVIDLLHWVLVSEKDPMLRSVSTEEYDLIIAKTVQSRDTAKPTHVFEVVPAQNSKPEEKFQRQKEGYDTALAFHGSKLTNFYSILNHGLHQHMCKNGQFGEGIYLSTKLSVSMNYSPNGAAWGASMCGAHISCVAICEYVNNPDCAKTHVKDYKRNKVPQTYIVVTNNEVVRVRYILFYGLNIRDEFSPKNLAIAWVNRNRYFLTVCCYTLFLASIGIANSGNGLYLRHIISKRSSDLLRIFKNMFSDDT